MERFDKIVTVGHIELVKVHVVAILTYGSPLVLTAVVLFVFWRDQARIVRSAGLNRGPVDHRAMRDDAI